MDFLKTQTLPLPKSVGLNGPSILIHTGGIITYVVPLGHHDKSAEKDLFHP